MRVLTYIGIFILFSALIFAQESNLTCQYRYNTTEQVEKLNVYDVATGQFVTNSIETKEFEEGIGVCKFKIYNNNDVPLSMRLIFNYIIDTNWGASRYINRMWDSAVTIPARDFQIFSMPDIGPFLCSFDKNSFKVTFIDNNQTDARYEKENVTTEHCNLCNGNICFNDGVICNNSINCGSESCIRGRCSQNKDCYLNDCQCGPDEIQCRNDLCVRIDALEYGMQTSCGLKEECKTRNIDNGKCSMSPEQIQIKKEAEEKARQDKLDAERKADGEQAAVSLAEQNRIKAENDKAFWSNMTNIFLVGFVGAIIIIGIIVVGALIWKWLKNKGAAIALQRTIADAERKSKEIDDKEKELIAIAKQFNVEKLKLERRIASISRKEDIQNSRLQEEYDKQRAEMESQLQQMQVDFESQKNEVEQAQCDLTKQLSLIETEWQKIRPFPHPLANNHLVIINPYLGGYYCFYQKNKPLDEYPYYSLLHRWIWKENHNGEWPRKGFHIHHIDHDKYNNSIENLEEIEGEEHFRLHKREYE